MATVEANIREIKKAVYGRDVREPIADALVKIHTKIAEKELPSRGEEVSRIERLSGHQLIGAEVSSLYGEDWILIFTRREE